MSTFAEIAALLTARNLAALVGLKEDQWFDAKQCPGYEATAKGRLELAKDVSSFLNAEGGHIIIGLTTQVVQDEQTEQVSGLQLVPETNFNVAQIMGVLREYLYPVQAVDALSVSWVEDVAGHGLGVGVITIPPLPPDRRLILMKKVIEDGGKTREIVFGFAVRIGSNSVPDTIADVYRMCRDGRSSTAERLTRIEGKLDVHLRQQEEAPQQPSPDDVAQQRVRRVLGDE